MNNSKYKVIPGLSIRGDELRRRLGNRSLEISQDGKSYSQEPKITETLRMGRTDLFRSHLHDVHDVKELGNKIKDANTKKNKELADLKLKQAIEQAKAEAIAEYIKSKGNG